MSLSSALLFWAVLLISSLLTVVRTSPTLLQAQSNPNAGPNSISHRNIQPEQRDANQAWPPQPNKPKSGWDKFTDKLFGDPNDQFHRRNQSRKASNRNFDDDRDELTVERSSYVDSDGNKRHAPRGNPLSMPVVLLFLLIVAVCIAVVMIEANYHFLDGLFRVVDQEDSSIEERLTKYGGQRDKSKKSKRKRKNGRKTHKSKRIDDDEDDDDEDESDEVDDKESRRRRKKHRKGHRRHHKSSKTSSSKKRKHSRDEQDDSFSGQTTSGSKRKMRRKDKEAQDDSGSS